MKRFLGVVTTLSLAVFLMPSVSMAFWFPPQAGADRDREVRVSNRNSASIVNVVDSQANTGGNWAGGSEGGNGGNGGDIEADGKYAEVEDSGAGNGGNGAGASDGGLITTGHASTSTAVMNMANSNDTRVSDDCGCEGRGDVTVRVSNSNRAHVFNAVGSSANTGYNNADGSEGGNGGNGGDIEADGYWGGEVEDSGAGHGGHGGSGGVGGTITTGNAHTSTDVVTVVNRNVTRVR